MTEYAGEDRSAWHGRAGAGFSNAGSDRLAHQIDHHQIAARAHAIYESRRGCDGSADDDWRRAEAEYTTDRANEIRFG